MWPFLLQRGPDRLAGRGVACFSRADEPVMAVIHEIRQFAEILRHPVGKALGVNTGGFRGFLYLLAVFVGAGQEEYVVAIQPLNRASTSQASVV